MYWSRPKQEEFEDTKGAIRIRISKKNRQHNSQMYKRRSTKHTYKDQVTQTPLNPWVKSGVPEGYTVNQSYPKQMLPFHSFSNCFRLIPINNTEVCLTNWYLNCRVACTMHAAETTYKYQLNVLNFIYFYSYTECIYVLFYSRKK